MMYLATSKDALRNITVGETFVLPLDPKEAGKRITILDPADRPYEAVASLEEGYAIIKDAQTNLPGFYRLKEEKEEGVDFFAANVDTNESDLTPLEERELRKWAKSFKFTLVHAESVSAEGALTKERGGLWRPLLFIVLVLFVVEFVFGYIFASRRR